VVRFFLTDVSNTRMYNLGFGDLPIKLVGADLSNYEREIMVPNVVIAPAQRYIAEVRFDKPGTVAITNRVQALANFTGLFVPIGDTLGTVTVLPEQSAKDFGPQFARLRANAALAADIDKYRRYASKAPDKELLLTVNMQGLPVPVTAFMSVDTMYFPPAEWADGMPDMNWVSTAKEVRWILRDVVAGKDNMDIDWHFTQGDVVKIRLTNDGQSIHPMSHPIHFHGQRFLVVARNGRPEKNLAWRDVLILPVGTSADILLDASNPGKWMAHCHIAEHLEAGMHLVFTVDPKKQ
ncbi:MAG: multicopper oxidase domain-containing protein, partial [Gemmatimonadaceae bacterium]